MGPWSGAADDQIPVGAFAAVPAIMQMQLDPAGEYVVFIGHYRQKDRHLATGVCPADGGECIAAGYHRLTRYDWAHWRADGNAVVSYRSYFSRKRKEKILELATRFDPRTPEYTTETVVARDYFAPYRSKPPELRMPDIVAPAPVYAWPAAGERIVTRRWRARALVRRSEDAAIVRDGRGAARLEVGYLPDSFWVRETSGGQSGRWLWSFAPFSQEQVWPLGFDADPNLLYVAAYREGRRGIFSVRLDTERVELSPVLSDESKHVCGRPMYSTDGAVIGFSLCAGGGDVFLDDAYADIPRVLEARFGDADTAVVNFSANERRVLVFAGSDRDPGAYHVLDRDSGTVTTLAKRNDRLPRERMAGRERIEFTTTDGGARVAHLTLPADAPEEPLPTVVFPHGGPPDLEIRGFDYWTQFFASRGYAVLQVNYRDARSGGFEVLPSGLQNVVFEPGSGVRDATQWLIEQGVADPERICIVGAGYGGYAALLEAALRRQTYRCVVSYAGPTDLRRHLKRFRKSLDHRVFTSLPGNDPQALALRSPLHLADAISQPVFLAHGDLDEVVDVDHSRRMMRALKRLGRPVEYLPLEGGDHYLSHPRERLALLQGIERFLAEHLQP